MAKLKIGIVEDEIIIADNICKLLKDLGYDVTEPAINYTEALQMIEQDKPDLILLDIQLSGKKDGIDVAATIREKYHIPFIFLTANSDAATIERAKKVNPPAFLVKPFTKEDLFSAIEITFNNFSSHQNNHHPATPHKKDFLFIKEGYYFHKVFFSEILYMESEHVYINIYLVNGKKILLRASLNEYLNHFDTDDFIRVHRSYAVNLVHVDGIDQIHIIVKGNKIPLGKTYRDDLISKLNLG